MSKLIVKHNNFVEAKYNLTLTELKIIAKLSSMIQKEDDDITCYKFSLQKLLEELNLSSENYTHLIDSLDRLLTRIIIIKRLDSNTFLKTTFLSSAEYFLDDSTVELSFDKKLKSYLLQLKNNFTMYQFENVVALSSVYAIRIYELCKQYEKIKERIIDVVQLKKILEIEDKYKKYNDFKKKVLEIAEREINEKTDIHISFEEIKTSRKVTSIKFNIEKKEFEKSEIKEAEKTYSEEVEMLYEKIKEIERIDSIKDVIEESIKRYRIERVESNIKYSNDFSNTNYTAFLKKALKEDYAKIEREKKKKKAEIKKKQEQLEEMKSKREEEEKKLTRKLAEKIYETKTEEEIEEYLKNISERVKKSVFFDKKEIIIAKIIEELDN